MTKVTLIKADVTTFSDSDLFHALLTDSPYHLTSITKRFGGKESAEAKFGTDGVFQRSSKGFMGKTWDGGDVAFRPETWTHLLSQLYPGAFGMSFASPKLDHRMRVAIEDGGAVMHPTLGWVYSSGFPKATRIDKKADDAQGLMGETIFNENATRNRQMEFTMTQGGAAHYEPTTELGQAWAGHRYGQQALAPALEPIAVFQRPYEGRPIGNILETGAGALWIDGGRIGTDEIISGRVRVSTVFPNWDGHEGKQPVGVDDYTQHSSGRWPKNMLLQHDPECQCVGELDDAYVINRFQNDMHPFGDAVGEAFDTVEMSNKALLWECVETCAVRRLAEKNGIKKSGLMTADNNVNSEWGYHGGERSTPTIRDTYNDEGTVDRFFYQAHWGYDVYERLNGVDPEIYCPKSSKAEKNLGLSNFSEKQVGDGRKKTIDNPFQRGETPRQNTHPSVKPLELCRYLATLLLPPPMYAPRRIYVPFCGSGSEVIGCILAGWDEVVGVDIDTDNEYLPIARARVDFWKDAISKYGLISPREILKLTQKKPKKSKGDLALLYIENPDYKQHQQITLF